MQFPADGTLLAARGVMIWVLWGATALVSAYWLHQLYGTLRAVRSVPVLATWTGIDPMPWPRVSLVIAACNEEETLEAAVRSRLDDDYPDLEVVLVDDRSTDATGAIVDRLAASDPRVRAVHVTELPHGWLGKVHAMHVGAGDATGSWLLFSDADVYFAPGTIRRAMSLAMERGVDHMAMMPDCWPGTFLLDMVLAAFLRLATVGGRLHAVPDPQSRAAVGGGLFNLVRRSAFDRTPGFEWLKLEVADDLGLAQMMKQHGGQACVVNARGHVGLHFYRTLGEMFRGTEKNGFALVGRFRVAPAVARIVALVACEVFPLVAWAFPVGWPMRVVILATAVIASTTQALVNRWLARPMARSLVPPLGAILFAAMMAWSMVRTLSRGGIEWRGTRYPLALLREGVRARIP